MKYLNLSGLTYFLNKIKTYVTSSTYLNSIGISNTDIDDIADDAGYSSGSLPASEDIFITGDIIPNTDNSVDLGASSKNIKMIYTKGITINGTQFLPSDYIPRSGGAVMTSNSLGRAVDTDELRIDGGTGWNDGASIGVSGKSRPDRNGHIVLHPAAADTSLRKDMWIMPDGTWTWTGTAVQIISDQRLKQQISNIDDKLLDAWKDVTLCQFKYNDAVDQKGDNARLHTGYVVQQIDEACASHGVDISKYGLYCHEEYPEETEEVEVTQEDGTIKKETKVIREASEHYSLRYTEIYAIECAYLRRENSRLKENLASLEERLEKLEKAENSENQEK